MSTMESDLIPVVLTVLTITLGWLVVWVIQKVGQPTGRVAPIGLVLRLMRLAYRHTPLVRAVVWLVCAVIVLVVLADNSRNLVALVLMGGLVLASALAFKSVLVDVFAGLRLGFRGSLQPGDLLEVEELIGEIHTIGLTITTITTPAGHRHIIPNHRLLQLGYTAIEKERCELGAEVVLPMPADVELEVAKEAAYRVAILSRYANPRRRPEVLVECADGTVLLRVRGYTSLLEHRDRYRSDVVENWTLAMKTRCGGARDLQVRSSSVGQDLDGA